MGFNAYKGGGKMIITQSSVSAWMSDQGGMSAGSGFSVGSGKNYSQIYEGNVVAVTAFSIAFGTGMSTGGNSQFANFIDTA
ncbi:flagellin, partial [Campylobacter volucris]|nr:flagellin [Campylobacter volucris]